MPGPTDIAPRAALTRDVASLAFVASKRSAATRAAYGRDLAAFAVHLGSDPADADAVSATLLAASVADVTGWRDAMIASGHRPASVNRRLAALRTFYKFAKATGALDALHPNPVEFVECPRVSVERQRRPFLEAEDVAKLLDAPDPSTRRGARDRAALGLMAVSGLRREEVSHLRCGDLAAVGEPPWDLTVDGKGDKTRIVAVDGDTVAAIHAYLRLSGRDLGAHPAAPIFLGRDKRSPISVDAVDDIVARNARAVGLPGRVAPHALRRSFGTITADQGATPDQRRRAMGHASLTTTSRYDRRQRAVVLAKYPTKR